MELGLVVNSARYVTVAAVSDVYHVMVAVMSNVTLVAALAHLSIISNSPSISKITMTTMSSRRLICPIRQQSLIFVFFYSGFALFQF